MRIPHGLAARPYYQGTEGPLSLSFPVDHAKRTSRRRTLARDSPVEDQERLARGRGGRGCEEKNYFKTAVECAHNNNNNNNNVIVIYGEQEPYTINIIVYNTSPRGKNIKIREGVNSRPNVISSPAPHRPHSHVYLHDIIVVLL